MAHTFNKDKYIRPPGSLTEIIAHPNGPSQPSLDVALFYEHRYAFYFWNNWTRKWREQQQLVTAPALVTFDWHQDLAWPTNAQRRQLQDLDLSSNEAVAYYSWTGLSHINDEQIIAAAHLDLVGDIYVLCRQGKNEHDWLDKEYIDYQGRVHWIKKFRTIETLEQHMTLQDLEMVFWDVDLDFFTLDNPYSGSGTAYTYVPDDEITNILDPHRSLMKWMLQRLGGITIAIEPAHCGGLQPAHRLLDKFNDALFHPGLLSRYGNNTFMRAGWKHLQH